jgi:isoprenylcysteine carboxyl methyltransferase (ICMT) family protein YpbQ
VLFVLSLLACAYAYLIVWAASTDRANDWVAWLVDAALFGVFAGHHSFLAREGVKRHIEQWLPGELVRSFYVWTASLLLILVLFLWRPVGGDIYHMRGWLAVVAAGIQLAGLWLIAKAVSTIDALELAGIKPAHQMGALQERGPYRVVRHPVYSGWCLALFAAAHMTADRLAFAAISTAYLLVAIPWEERSLLQVFGPAYARYREKVRWRVIPFVY